MIEALVTLLYFPSGEGRFEILGILFPAMYFFKFLYPNTIHTFYDIHNATHILWNLFSGRK